MRFTESMKTYRISKYKRFQLKVSYIKCIMLRNRAGMDYNTAA